MHEPQHSSQSPCYPVRPPQHHLFGHTVSSCQVHGTSYFAHVNVPVRQLSLLFACYLDLFFLIICPMLPSLFSSSWISVVLEEALEAISLL